MKKSRLYILLGLIVCSITLLGCESEDDEKMLKAQNCFNSLDDSQAGNAGLAATCQNILSGLSTPEANLLLCGLELWAGGISTTSIITAFDAYEVAAPNDKESTLINALALNNKATADNAYNYCKASNAAGMIYVAGLIRLGTYMDLIDGTQGNDTGAGIVADCITNGGAGDCRTAENGQMLIDIADVYCIGESADNDVCTALNSAINANPGDPQGVIDQFLTNITP